MSEINQTQVKGLQAFKFRLGGNLNCCIKRIKKSQNKFWLLLYL